MPLVVEEDVPLDPFYVGVLSPNAVMLHSDDFAHLIEKFGHGSERILLLNPVLCRTSAV
jgi:hypothetical protein